MRRAPGLAGLHGDALALRVGARPVDGAANREVLAVLAAALGRAPDRLELIVGQPRDGTSGCGSAGSIAGCRARGGSPRSSGFDRAGAA